MNKKRMALFFGLIFLLFSVFLLINISAFDWPKFHNDLNNTGFQNETINVNKNSFGLMWNYTTGGQIWYSSPAIANGYAYITSDLGVIYQLNASNVSQLIASYTTGNRVESTPAVANGYVLCRK